MPSRAMTRKEAMQFLASKTEGRLATVDAIGQPYITPLNHVFYEGRVYFHSRLTGRKIENLAANRRVCYETSELDASHFLGEKPCACSTRYRSVLVFGTAALVEDAERKVAVLNALMERFSEGRPFRRIEVKHAATCAVVEILPDEITGKINFDGDE